jgi:hypothetical protein
MSAEPPPRRGFVRFGPGVWTVRDRDGNVVVEGWSPSEDDLAEFPEDDLDDDDEVDDDEDDEDDDDRSR